MYKLLYMLSYLYIVTHNHYIYIDKSLSLCVGGKYNRFTTRNLLMQLLHAQ